MESTASSELTLWEWSEVSCCSQTWCVTASCHTSQCGTWSLIPGDQSSPQSQQMCPSTCTHRHKHSNTHADTDRQTHRYVISDTRRSVITSKSANVSVYMHTHSDIQTDTVTHRHRHRQTDTHDFGHQMISHHLKVSKCVRLHAHTDTHSDKHTHKEQLAGTASQPLF